MEKPEEDERGLGFESNFKSLYKSCDWLAGQEARRSHLLAEQKRLREELVDSFRGIGEANVQDDDDEAMEVDVRHKRGGRFKSKAYRNQIMLSEWFVEVPSDLDVAWYFKCCPNGQRNLVVAKNRVTTAYNRHGEKQAMFNSVLPNSTILDCIFSFKTKAYYVLDIIRWAKQSTLNCDGEFRFYWLQTKLSEVEEIDRRSTHNKYPFYYVPHEKCAPHIIKQTLEKYPIYEDNTPKIDGILFYHSEAAYTPGTTPLVGWLKPYMVPEILNIPVAEAYMLEKPKKFTTLRAYLEYADKKRKEAACKKEAESMVLEEKAD